jgi:hypothetical protein
MATDKQKANIEALLTRPKKRRLRDRIYGYSESYSEGFVREDGGIDYLSDRDLAEVKEKLEHGGYNHIA